MQVSRKLLKALVIAAAALAVSVAGALAASRASKNDKITIKSGSTVKPGFSITDMLRFTPFDSSIKSGGTLTIVGGKGAYSEGPHTFSLVKRSQLPKTAAQVNKCKVCQQIGQEMGVNPNAPPGTPPAHPFVDGGDGFNKPGDTVGLAGPPLKLKITAKPGTTLYFICALHPWMQGRIHVVK